MAETTISKAMELRGDRGGRCIPHHATVDGKVPPPCADPMAVRHQLLIPVLPRSPRLGRTNAFEVRFRKLATSMQRIESVDFSGSQWGESADRISDGRVFGRSKTGGLQFDRTKP